MLHDVNNTAREARSAYSHNGTIVQQKKIEDGNAVVRQFSRYADCDGILLPQIVAACLLLRLFTK